MSSQYLNEEGDAFESKREVVFEGCSIKRRRFMSLWEEKAKICDDARQYLENTMKEFRIPMNAATLPFALDYKNSITKIQNHLDEMVNTSLSSINHELDAKKIAWKQLMQSKYVAYRESHDSSVVKTHHALLDSGIPALSRIEQSLRYCSQYMEVSDELTAMAKAVNGRTVQSCWSERLNAAWTEGYPAPRVFLPTKLSAGLELVREGISEMELSFEHISASEPFEAKDTDWFSYSCLEPLVHQTFCGSLVSGVRPDGTVTIQLCEFDNDNSLSRAEVLELIIARLRYRLLLGDPTLRQLALSRTVATDVRDGTSVAICRWNDTHPQIYRGQIETVDAKARRCQVYLIDFGRTDSFDFEEVFVDERCAKDLRSIPPLSIRCHLHAPWLKLKNPAEVEAAIRTLEEGNKGRFTFSISAEHVVDEAYVWEIFVSDAVSREFRFPPPPQPPSPPPEPQPQPLLKLQPPQSPQPPQPPQSSQPPQQQPHSQPQPPLSNLTIKVEAPVLKAPLRPKNFHRKNSTSTHRKGQPSSRTPPVAPKAEPKTPPVPKVGPVDRPKAGSKTPPVLAKHGRSDRSKRGPKIYVHRMEKPKPELKPPPVPKANKPIDTRIPQTPPSSKERYQLTTPPMSNSGRMNKEKYEPSTAPLPNADPVGKSKCESKPSAPDVDAARTQASPRAAATHRTPPGPRAVPVANKAFRSTNTTWQKELVQSIVQNNSKRKDRDAQSSASTQQYTEWNDWGDE